VSSVYRCSCAPEPYNITVSNQVDQGMLRVKNQMVIGTGVTGSKGSIMSGSASATLEGFKRGGPYWGQSNRDSMDFFPF
jgi:hypothetical protein